jgi:Fe-S-cluster containining protein
MANILYRLKISYLLLSRIACFFSILFSRGGLGSKSGRIFAIGKVRRAILSCSPSLAMKLKKHYGLTGGCTGCGVSCNLLFPCPEWDAQTRLCTIYESRPNVCRLFPITPSDIKERDLAGAGKPCGYRFGGRKKSTVRELAHAQNIGQHPAEAAVGPQAMEVKVYQADITRRKEALVTYPPVTFFMPKTL